MAQEQNIISKKKPYIDISKGLRKYLRQYMRQNDLPVQYNDLLDYKFAFPLMDKTGKDTLWETVIFAPDKAEKINTALTQIYINLKAEGHLKWVKHLSVERIDYCTFGNSNPFRIRIVNNLNDNYDYFYIKKADASRIYGLELEYILSPNRINYSVYKETLIEEHVAGIPGDQFIDRFLHNKQTNKTRVAKEFVKFNERCFVRLLGDMRSYNWVMDITPDFDDVQYRIRAIDFDQQSYEGKKTLYLPQFFKENYQLVELGMDLLTAEPVEQYQKEERSLIARRLVAARYQMKDLMDVLTTDTISTEEKTNQLKNELAEHYKNKQFLRCKNMGELVKRSLRMMLKSSL